MKVPQDKLSEHPNVYIVVEDNFLTSTVVEQMNTEQLLLKKWRSLPPDKQQEVINFVEFLEFKKTTITQPEVTPKSKPPLGQRFRQIRQEIVASDLPLLDWEGVEREKAERRGGYQEDA